MPKARFVPVVIASLVGLVWPTAALWSAPPDDLADAVRAIANEAIESNRVVGMSIGVALREEILLADGFGHADLELQVPAEAETVYRIGSITKQFTAAAVLQLAEQKKLAIEDPLTKFLPDYPAHAQSVTIRHLLQHTSGIQSFTSLPSYRQLMRHDATHDEMLARFKDLPPHFKPGERYRYCNSGYYLLGVILESAAEETYEQYLQQSIFEPLGLRQTYYDRARSIIPHRAQGYRRIKGAFEHAHFLSMTQPFSAGALASTVLDLIKWQQALVKHRLLSEESYQAMTTRGVLADGKSIDYGFGLLVHESKGRKTIEHGGGINGFRSHLAYFPESGHTIVVLANSEGAQPGRISGRIANHLFKSPSADDTGSPSAERKSSDER